MARMKEPPMADKVWTEWVAPTPKQAYRMGCCDCGLVHNVEFKAVQVKSNKGETFVFDKTLSPRKVRVLFRVSRNNRSTAALRRKKNGVKSNG